MTHILRCRVTAHHVIDRQYDGSAKAFQEVLEQHEATLAALKATGAEILVADARPVNVRAPKG